MTRIELRPSARVASTQLLSHLWRPLQLKLRFFKNWVGSKEVKEAYIRTIPGMLSCHNQKHFQRVFSLSLSDSFLVTGPDFSDSSCSPVAQNWAAMRLVLSSPSAPRLSQSPQGLVSLALWHHQGKRLTWGTKSSYQLPPPALPLGKPSWWLCSLFLKHDKQVVFLYQLNSSLNKEGSLGLSLGLIGVSA